METKPYLTKCPVCTWPIATHKEELAHAQLHLIAWGNVASDEGEDSSERSAYSIRNNNASDRSSKQYKGDDSAS